MRSSWPSRFLLPLAQVVAEGGWLAVAYAALQAASGERVWLGPLELAALAWAGMAWGRRSRWRSPGAEALGLPLLALLAGAGGWLTDPEVRRLLAEGDPLAAAGAHVPGWLGAVAFWRGEVHRSADEDDAIQDRLLRWAIPGLALPWAVGQLAADGVVEREFTAAAFVGTIFFVAAAFIAMGLARLEAVRASSGSDWRSNRSWLVLVGGVGLGVTAVAVPAAVLLDVPARSLLMALVGPLQVILIGLVLLATPVILLAARVAELLAPYLPEGFGLGRIRLPDLTVDVREVTSNAPVVVFYAVVGVILALELLVVAAVFWLRWQERRRARVVLPDAFEERAIVLPEPEPPSRGAPAAPAARRQRSRDGTLGAYLRALEALERDGRWARRNDETPAAHARRAHATGLGVEGFRRLAAAYQLLSYGSRRPGHGEERRAAGRLRALRRRLRG